MDYVAMGKRIKKRREYLYMTQAELAELCNLSTAFVGHIERGTRKASIETLYALCNALEVSSDYLLGLTVQEEIEQFLADLTQEEINAGMKLIQKIIGNA